MPPTCVSCAISRLPVDRGRPIQDLRLDQQATSRAPGARFRDSELDERDERAKEAAGSAVELELLHAASPTAKASATTRDLAPTRPWSPRHAPKRAPGVGYPLLVLAAKWRISQTRSQCTLGYPEPVRATRRGAARTRSGYPTPGAGISRSGGRWNDLSGGCNRFRRCRSPSCRPSRAGPTRSRSRRAALGRRPAWSIRRRGRSRR